MDHYRLLELLLKHQAYGKISCHHSQVPENFFDDLMIEIEDEIIEELGLDLDSNGTIYPEKPEPTSLPARLLKAVDDIFEYLKESEIDGWENLRKDLVDLRHKALDEMDLLEMEN
tara:strand:+ start:79 stop:423 length:345 start_codon:yes stop_codon:yes gene_type:complete